MLRHLPTNQRETIPVTSWQWLITLLTRLLELAVIFFLRDADRDIVTVV